MSKQNSRIKIFSDKKQKPFIRSLTLLYVVSLSIIACSSIAGQVLIQRSLTRQELDIRVITIAQRQEILSQQLTKTALAVKIAQNPVHRRKHITELQAILSKWEQQRQKLQRLETANNMTSGRSQQVRRMTQQLSPSYQMILDAATELITNEGLEANSLRQSKNLSERPLRQILEAEQAFIQGMDNLISIYNQHTEKGVVQLRQLETYLICLTILVLVLEGVFIFRPAVALISFALTDLAMALQKTQHTASLLANEQEKSEHLLLNILPSKIAQRLKENSTAIAGGAAKLIADNFASVTVLFADIVGFTQLSTQVSPQELVALLNKVFSSFDTIAETHSLEKIKTIGDAYMVVGGLPNLRPDHAEAIVSMALDMLEVMTSFNLETGLNCQIRIGINTGPVVAGVIGIKKFLYDLWGDTVNTASRMESHSLPGCIQITEETYEIIKDKFIFESRGVMQIKGKGEMQTYFVMGRK